MTSLEDVETQKKGAVLIDWLLQYDGQKHVDRNMAWKVAQMLKSFPLRFTAIHLCTHKSNQEIKDHLALLLLAFDSVLRVRARCHCGTAEEVSLALQSFGIPARALPLSKQGETIAGHYLERLAQRERLEEAGITGRVWTPSNEDVVFGRGRQIQDHIGNLKYRYLIDQSRSKYDEASRVDGRTSIAETIVSNIQARGGRFLKNDSMGWEEVPLREARIKVTMAFRSKRKLAKKADATGVESNQRFRVQFTWL